MAPSPPPKSLLLPVSDLRGAAAAGDQSLFKGSAMTKRGASAAFSYMTCAVLLVMFNKAALSSYNFPSGNVITLLQMICSVSILYAMKRLKLISFTVGEPWTASDSANLVPLGTLLHTLPLSFAYLLYMLASMESIRGVNVPMYTTLRRTTVVFTMIMEYLLIGQKYSSPVIGSVALIVFGAFVAGARDLSFDTYGYSLVFIANITTAVYLATISRIGKSSGLNSFGLMWCNGVVCGPLLLFWTYVRGDLDMAMNFPYLFSPGFQITLWILKRNVDWSRRRDTANLKEKQIGQGMVVLLFSCIMAFFLNYCIFLNTTLNSAVTQTICGNLKDFFTIGLGWLLFGGLPFDLLNVIGQILGFTGSVIYAYCKLKGK